MLFHIGKNKTTHNTTETQSYKQHDFSPRVQTLRKEKKVGCYCYLHIGIRQSWPLPGCFFPKAFGKGHCVKDMLSLDILKEERNLRYKSTCHGTWGPSWDPKSPWTLTQSHHHHCGWLNKPEVKSQNPATVPMHRAYQFTQHTQNSNADISSRSLYLG